MSGTYGFYICRIYGGSFTTRKLDFRGHTGRTKGGWDVNAAFPTVGTAIKAVRELRKECPGICPLGVMHHGLWVWREHSDHARPDKERIFPDLAPITPQEEQVEYAEKQPLHIKRTDLITALQSNLDAEKAKRDEVTANLAARRKKASDALKRLSPDELLNLVGREYAIEDISDMVDEALDTGRLKSPEVVVSTKESDLEKTVRVLTLAADEQIEIAPQSDLYRLL